MEKILIKKLEVAKNLAYCAQQTWLVHTAVADTIQAAKEVVFWLKNMRTVKGHD